MSRPARVRSQGDAFRPDIQGLRAIAVMLVAAQHAGVPSMAGGYVGVDVFLVISGFVITGVLLRRADRTGSVGLLDFYGARARRILPAATLILLAASVSSVVWLNYVRATQVLHDAVWSAFFAANYHFASQATDYFARDEPPSPLQHFWTLAVEEQFYLVWPVVLGLAVLVISRWSTREPGEPVPRRPLAGLLALVIGASLWWSIHDTDADPGGAYFSTIARTWELGAGALLAVAAAQLARAPAAARIAAGWAGLAAILIAAAAYSPGTAFPGYAAILPVGGGALVVAAGVGGLHPRGAASVLTRRPFLVVGALSYSFYLWHWPVLVIPAEHAGHSLGLAANLLLLCLALALSALTYMIVENPVRYAALLAVRPTRSLALWAISVGVVLFCSHAALGYLHGQEPSAYALRTPGAARSAPYIHAVARSASADVLGQPIPRELAPAPSRLLDDQFDLSGCDADLGAATTSRICRLGSDAPRHTVVVFGDSHARMWMPAVLHWAAARQLAVVPLIKEGCTATSWSDRSTAAPECAGWYIWALGQVRSIRPDAAVVATAYATSTSDESSATLMREIGGLTSELRDLRARTETVAVIQDPPRTATPPVDCLLQPDATLGSCAFRPSPAWSTVDAGVRSAARGTARVVRTNQWLCAQGVCPMVIGHVVVYMNTGHITSTYARWVERPLARELRLATGL